VKRIGVATFLIIGFFFIAAPIYMKVPVSVNGRPAMNAQLVNNTWAVPLDEFVKLFGGGITLEPNFQLQGSKLVAVSSGGDMSAKKVQPASAAAPSGDIVIKIKSPGVGLLKIRKAGVVSNSVFKFEGKAFVPVADVARALGGTFTAPAGNVQPGQTVPLNFGPNGIIGPD